MFDMSRPVPRTVLEREAELADGKLCYKCDKVMPRDMFSGPRQRECKDCRSRRALSYGIEDKRQWMLDAARARARRKDLPFSLQLSDIVIPEKCPVFGFPLSFGTKMQRDQSPSLDRIKPELGYVPGNVLVVSWLANNIRGKFRSDQLRRVAEFYEFLE